MIQKLTTYNKFYPIKIKVSLFKSELHRRHFSKNHWVFICLTERSSLSFCTCKCSFKRWNPIHMYLLIALSIIEYRGQWKQKEQSWANHSVISCSYGFTSFQINVYALSHESHNSFFYPAPHSDGTKILEGFTRTNTILIICEFGSIVYLNCGKISHELYNQDVAQVIVNMYRSLETVTHSFSLLKV